MEIAVMLLLVVATSLCVDYKCIQINQKNNTAATTHKQGLKQRTSRFV